MTRRRALLLPLLLAVAACQTTTPATPTPSSDPIAVMPTLTPTATPAPTPVPVPGICSFIPVSGSTRESVVLLASVSEESTGAYIVPDGNLAELLIYPADLPGGLSDPAYRDENRAAMAVALEAGAAAAGIQITPGSLTAALVDGFEDQPRPSVSGKSYALGFARFLISTLTIENCPDLRDPTVVPTTGVDLWMRSTGIAYLVRDCADGALTSAEAATLFSGRALDVDSASLLEQLHAQTCGS